MKSIVVKIVFFAFLISLTGCFGGKYTRSRHIHTEYCGHSGYYQKNNIRKNTNLHYYDPKTGQRKHYGKRYIKGRHLPKWKIKNRVRSEQ